MTSQAPRSCKPHENPLRVLRTMRGLPQAYVAWQADITSLAIIRAEQAVYANPPPKLLTYLLESSDPAAVGFALDEETVDHLYHRFQDHVRKLQYGRLLDNFDFSTVPHGVHPFVDWRVRSGIKARIGPSKFFCVHPALLHKFEVHTHLINTPPGELLHALKVSGYSSETLDGLTNAYYTYKQHLHAEFMKKQNEEDVA